MTTSAEPGGLFTGEAVDASAVPSGTEPVTGNARVVAFGGGTGMAALLAGLKQYSRNITAVVTVTDNGGSSGRLRNDFDMVAPGDIRNCLIALADVDPLIAKVFQYRFNEADFKGHCFGNLFITVLTRVVGNFEDSIRALNGLLKVKGRVIPATSAKVSLVAHHPDGTKSTGEVQITRSRKPIERVELRPSPVALSQEIRAAIQGADLFLFGPGSLFTSVIPNLLIDGIMEAINSRGRPRVYIGNIMTQPGETDGFNLSDHIRALRRHVGGNFPDCVLAHEGSIPATLLAKYAAEKATPVAVDLGASDEFRGVRVVKRDFLCRSDSDTGGIVRHDPGLLARTIHEELLKPEAAPGVPAKDGSRDSSRKAAIAAGAPGSGSGGGKSRA